MMCSFRLSPPSLLSAGPACLGALLAFLFTTALQAQANAPANFAGHWEGVILVRPGETEVDFSVDVAPGPDGTYTGAITVPIHNIQEKPLEEVFQDGDTVSMAMRDGASLSFFRGTLASGGDRVAGDLTEGPQVNRFVMERREKKAAAAPAEMIRLGEDLAALKQKFNADMGPRLVMLLSSSCRGCLMSERLIDRYVLERIADERLHVYVVWVPISPKDTYETAKQASIHLVDPRVTHFWMDTISLAQAFKEPLGFTKTPAWDVFLLYSAGQKWGQGVPKPELFMHGSEELPRASRLNGEKLADEVEKLLGANSVAGTRP